MKTKLNLTMEDRSLTEVKFYAEKHQTTINDLVEGYWTKLTKPQKQKNIVDLVNELDAPFPTPSTNLKSECYSKWLNPAI